MNDLFSSQQSIEIELYYKLEKTKNGQSVPVVIKEEEYTKLKADAETKDRVKVLRTFWNSPSWKQANDLLKSSTTWNHFSQTSEIDWNVFRDQRLKSLLLKWDAKAADGTEIPCNESSINMLHQNIALKLLEMYDEATRVSPEEETKN